MPTKESYLIYFLVISTMLISMQVFVYFNLARIVRRDFGLRARRMLVLVKWSFVAMNLPLLFLFLRKQIHGDVALLTQIMFFPFTIWQALMIVWTLILIPFAIFRGIKRLFRNPKGTISVETVHK